MGRALDSVLQPAGYRVLRAFTGMEAQEQARSKRPDVILIATPLPDRDGTSLCRALRRDPAITPGLPIIGVSTAPTTRELRLGWLRAGAWDFFTFPLDMEELLLKLEGYLQAKHEADLAREASLVDRATGFYNTRGLKRRARELMAEALRLHAAIACVALGLEPAPDQRRAETAGRAGAAGAAGAGGAGGAGGLPALRGRIASLLQTHARLSDTIGWSNGGELVILAPATDADGAIKLARRLAEAIATAPSALEVRAGYEAVADAHATPVEPEDLLARASAALAAARREQRGERIRRFGPAP